MGVFDVAHEVVSSASGIIAGNTSIDISSVIVDMEERLMEMDVGPLFGLWFQSLFVGITMWALTICIFIIVYGRMIEIYSKTKDVYVTYRKSGYSKKFLEEHESDIIIHKAAKKAFDELGVKKLPTIKSLQVEFAELLSTKKTAYADLKKIRDEIRELSVHKSNYEELRDLEEREERKEKERGRE